MRQSQRQRDEELRRKQARRWFAANHEAAIGTAAGLDPRLPPPQAQLANRLGRREEQTRRAFASHDHDLQALQSTIGNTAVRTAVDGKAARQEREQAMRRRQMTAELLGRDADWDAFDDWGEVGGDAFGEVGDAANDGEWTVDVDLGGAEAFEPSAYTVRDQAAGLDVTYYPGQGAPDVNLKQVEQNLGGGSPLPQDTREYMEWRFGVSFDRVRIHTGPKADAISKALFAHAFALGAHVAFQSDTYRPGSRSGDRLLAHELTHVVQAGQAKPIEIEGRPRGGVGNRSPLGRSVDPGLAKSGTVSEPTDAFEVEAEAMADWVIRVGRAEFAAWKRDGAVKQKQAEEAEEDQEKREQLAAAKLDSALNSSGKALDSTTQAKLEGYFGRDLGQVRIHDDSTAAEAAKAVEAHAFTVGTDIYFGAGELRPGTPDGDALIAHEVTHVVQHLEGRAGSATSEVDGVPVTTPTDGVEREAYAVEADFRSGAATDVAPIEGPVEAAVDAGAQAEGQAHRSAFGDLAKAASGALPDDLMEQAGALLGGLPDAISSKLEELLAAGGKEAEKLQELMADPSKLKELADPSKIKDLLGKAGVSIPELPSIPSGGDLKSAASDALGGLPGVSDLQGAMDQAKGLVDDAKGAAQGLTDQVEELAEDAKATAEGLTGKVEGLLGEGKSKGKKKKKDILDDRFRPRESSLFNKEVPGAKRKSAAERIQQAKAGLSGPSGALPHADAIQQAFGKYAPGDIPTHRGGAASEAASEGGAKAYALDGEIVLGEGGTDLHTVAHEAAHVVQQRAGLAPSEGVGAPGDAFERNADAVADAVVAGRSAEGLLASFVGAAPAFAPSASGLSFEGGGGEDVLYDLKVGPSGTRIRIPADKAEEPTYTAPVGSFPGLDGVSARLTLQDKAVTQARVSGAVTVPIISGNASFTADAAGNVSGSIEKPWTIGELGSGSISLGVAGGSVTGTGTLSPTEVNAAGVQVTNLSGSVAVQGLSATANASGEASVASGMLSGAFTIGYSESTVNGSLDGEISVADIVNAFGTGPAPVPRLNLTKEGPNWSGNIDTTVPVSAPGITGAPHLNLAYSTEAGFSGTGDGEFGIAHFLAGSVSVTVGSSGGLSGTFTAASTDFDLGPIHVGAINLSASLNQGRIAGTATGDVTGMNNAVSGGLSGSLAADTGLTVTPNIQVNLPQMQGTTLGLGYSPSAGFEGSAEVQASIDVLSGTARIAYEGGQFSASGAFNVDVPLLNNTTIEVGYGEGGFSGSATIDAGDFNLGSAIRVTDSSISAGFNADGFTMGGTAAVSMAGGLVTGTMGLNYDGGLTGDINATFSPPGIAPVALQLTYGGGQFSGSATTQVNVPFTQGADLTVEYSNGRFSGNARADLAVPFMDGSVMVVVDTDGTITGTVQVAANDVNIPPLQVSGVSVTGSLASDGQLSISGTGSITGIPMVESADLTIGVSNGGFSGSVTANLNIPTMKSTSATINLHEDGSLSGSADVEAEIAGCTGAVHVEYADGAFSGTGTLGYSQGKFSGSIEAYIDREGAVGGTGRVSYAITDDLTVTGEVTLRPDGTMVVGGELECPDRIDLFSKRWEREIFSMTGRFGIPGLSVQLPVVGVVGLEAQLSGSLDAFAGMSIYLTDISARGTFDTANNEVDLEVGGSIVGEAEAGITAAARLAVGLGIGPAFIGGYVQIAGTAKMVASIGAGVNAHYNSGTDVLGLDLNLNASAGLAFELEISGGITASVDLWLVSWEKDWELASKTWSYNPGVNFDYNPQLSWNLGEEPPDSAIQPSSTPSVDGNKMAQEAGGQAGDGGGSGAGTTLQKKESGAGMARGAAAQKAAAAGTSGTGGPLPHLDAIQQSFGSHDVSGVKAHTDARAQDASRKMGAKAFATGNDVAFGSSSPDLHTAAHEAAHTVQQRAGVHTKNGVGQKGDKWEQHADAVADAVVAGRSAEPLLNQVAGPGGGTSGTVQHALLDGGSVNFPIDLSGGTMTLRVPTSALEGSHHSTPLPGSVPGITNPMAHLDISGGGITGGQLTGTLNYPVISGDAELAIDGEGNVSGEIVRPWNVPHLGNGDVTLGIDGGGIAGSATLAPVSVAAAGVAVSDFSGTLNVQGTDVTGSGSGTAGIANNMVSGAFNLTYGSGTVTGDMTGDIHLPDILAAYGSAGTPPQFAINKTAEVWSGNLSTHLPINAPGITGQPSLDLGYNSSSGFSGTGNGSFDIAQFISGTAEVNVSSAGGVGGTLTAGVTEMNVGPINVTAISLSANLDGGTIGGSGSATVSGAGDAISGSLTAGFDPATGMSLTPSIQIRLPITDSVALSMGYDPGSGFSGSATITPSLDVLTGTATLAYDQGNFDVSGSLGINLPVLNGSTLEVSYADGGLSAQAEIPAGDFNLGSVIRVTDSSVTAGISSDGFTFGGSGGVTMAGGLVAGNFDFAYDGGLTGNVNATFSPPGIEPVALALAYSGGQFSGSATTNINVPFTNGAELTISYANGRFSGNARADLAVPFVEGSVMVVVDTDGTIEGTVQVAANDVSVPPLALSGTSVTGSIDSNGQLSLVGTSTVTGIPMVQAANLRLGVSNGGFSGSIEAELDIPMMERTSATITLHENGSISGAADVEAEIAGCTGAVHVEYADGAFSGTGTLGYSQGKFSGSIEAAINREGEVSGTGRVSYAITDDLTVTGEVTLRPDGTMIVGGELECPDRIDLFSKRWEREIFSMTGRFGIPGLSVQLPVVGVVGLEAQLSGSLDAFAGMSVYLTDITARGTFDTANQEVDLDVGGSIVGEAEAGITAAARLAVGLGIGPAFIGGYVQIAGTAKMLASIGAGVNAHYNSGTDVLGLDLDLNASAGLAFDLEISGGITASVDLWLVSWEKDWELASKTWSYNPGVNFDYNPQMSWNLGEEPPDSAIQPSSTPNVDGNAMAQAAGGQAGDGGGSGDGTTVQRKESGAGMPKSVSKNAESGTSGGGKPLPHLAKIQSAFGAHDVTGVKAHTDSAAAAANKNMGSKAFATGNDVAFANGSPDLHTAAHEAAHTVQQRGGVQTKNGVGQKGDKYEQHADAVADAVVAGRSAEPLLNQVAGPGKGVSTSSAVQHKLEGPVQFAMLDGGSVNFDIDFGGTVVRVRVPTDELEGSRYRTTLPQNIPGFDGAPQVFLDISGGEITGGTISGNLAGPVLGGNLVLNFDGQGVVSGTQDMPWTIAGFGSGTVALGVADGQVTGTANLAPNDMSVPGLSITDVTGTVTIAGTTITGTGSGSASMAGGKLAGGFNANYNNGAVTGDLNATINIPSITNAFNNHATGAGSIPKLDVTLANGEWNGTVSLEFPMNAPGITGNSSIQLSYGSAGFSGSGSGSFDIVHFISGNVQNTVGNDGRVNGSFTAGTTDFSLGPIVCGGITLTGQLANGLISGSFGGSMTALGGKATGAIQATLSGAGGLDWQSRLAIDLPAVNGQPMTLSYDTGSGFAGTVTLSPTLSALDGSATLEYANSTFSASGSFGLTTPLVQGGSISVAYEDDQVKGSTTLQGNAINLPMITVSGSTIEASFDQEGVNAEGSANLAAANNLLAGTLTASWVDDDFNASGSGTLSPPTLNPVAFSLAKEGSVLTGEATGNLSIPNTESTDITIRYDGAQFGGRTDVVLDLPFLDNASGHVELAGTELSGSFAISMNTFSFDPLTVTSASVQGEIANGNLSLSGSAAVGASFPAIEGAARAEFDGTNVTGAGGFTFASSVFGSASMEVRYLNDRLTGSAMIQPAHFSIPMIRVSQSTLEVTLAETLAIAGRATVDAAGIFTGDLSASINAGDIDASIAGTLQPPGITPIDLSLEKQGDNFSGSVSATVAVPMTNGATVDVAYNNGQFSGGASIGLNLPIVDSATGRVEIDPEGTVGGSITVEAGDFNLSFLEVRSASVTAAIRNGDMDLSGDATLAASISALTGEATLNFAGADITGEGAFELASSLFRQARVEVGYDGTNVTGNGTIAANDISLPMIEVTNSSITVALAESFSLGGSATVNACGGMFTGNMTANYTGSDIDASVDGTFNPPGLNSVNVVLNKEGDELTGSASTQVDIPFTKSTNLTVTYANGEFGGRADIELDIPFLESGTGYVEITPEGQVNGGVTVNAGDINLPLVTVSNASISGEIVNGVFSLTGSGTVTGIPCVQGADFELGINDGNFHGKIGVDVDMPFLKRASGELEMHTDESISGAVELEAELAGCTGTVRAEYNRGNWSGSGTLAYNKGPFTGSVTANLSEEGAISGSGRVSYDITDDFTITAEVDLREDGSMLIGGRIECPDSIPLFEKRYEKNLLSFLGRFGIPGLSIQLPIVGVVGLEARLEGSLDVYAALGLELTDIVASGTFDTATDDVELDIGGTIRGKAEAGLIASIRLAIGLGIGPAFIGGYIQAAGKAGIEASVSAGVNAHYSSARNSLGLDIDLAANAGLIFELELSAGLTASIDLWLFEWSADYPLASKTFSYRPGLSFNYNPKFGFDMLGGGEPPDAAIEASNPPTLGNDQVANDVGGQAEPENEERYEPCRNMAERFELDTEDEFEKGIKENAPLLSGAEANTILGKFGPKFAGFLSADDLATVLADFAKVGAELGDVLDLMFANGATGAHVVAITEACTNGGMKTKVREDSWKAKICPVCSPDEIATVVDNLEGDLEFKCRWMVETGTNWGLVTAKVDAAPQNERDVMRTEEWMGIFVGLFTLSEIALLVDQLGGDLTFKLTWLFAASTDYATAQVKCSDAPQTERDPIRSETWKPQFAGICTSDNMAELVDILGGDLHYKWDWMFACDPQWQHIEVKASAAPQGERDAVRVPLWRDLMCGVVSMDEMALLVDILNGPLEDRYDWMLTQGTNWGHIQAKGEAAPQSERDVIRTDTWLGRFVPVVSLDEMAQLVDILGGDLAYKLHWMFTRVTDWPHAMEKIEAAPQSERDAVRTESWKPRFLGHFTHDELVVCVDMLAGRLAWKLDWLFTKGTNWGTLYAKVDMSPSDERAELETDHWMQRTSTVTGPDEMFTLTDMLGWLLESTLKWMFYDGTTWDHVRLKIINSGGGCKAEMLGNAQRLAELEGQFGWQEKAAGIELLGRRVKGSGDLKNDGAVAGAMAAAYSNSAPFPADPKNRHEEGGWIYQNIVTDAVSVITTKGSQASVDLSGAPEVTDSVIVGYFHTHPNPSKEPDENGVMWIAGPSPADMALTAMWEVPAFIQADVGVIAYGPSSRPHLTGPQGLPSPGSTPAPQDKSSFVDRLIKMSKSGGKWEAIRKILRDAPANERKGVQNDPGLMKWLVGMAPDVDTLVQLLNWEGYQPQHAGATQATEQIYARARQSAEQELMQGGKAEQGGGGAAPGRSEAKSRLKTEIKMTLLKLRRLLKKKDLSKVNKKRVFGLIVTIVNNWEDHLRADMKPMPKLVKACAAECIKITKGPLRPWFMHPLQTGKVLKRTIKKLRMYLKSPRHIGVEGKKDSTLAEDQDVQQMAAPGAAPGDGDVVAAARQGTSGAGSALPHLGVIQQAFGHHDVTGVRAHTGSQARDAAQSMGAIAFATGNDVAFAGQAGLHTAAHEAAHIVQQRAGVSLSGNVGQVGDRYERHADQVADAVVAGQSAEQLLDQVAGPGRQSNSPVQRQVTNVQMARSSSSSSSPSSSSTSSSSRSSSSTSRSSAGGSSATAAPATQPGSVSDLPGGTFDSPLGSGNVEWAGSGSSATLNVSGGKFTGGAASSAVDALVAEIDKLEGPNKSTAASAASAARDAAGTAQTAAAAFLRDKNAGTSNVQSAVNTFITNWQTANTHTANESGGDKVASVEAHVAMAQAVQTAMEADIGAEADTYQQMHTLLSERATELQTQHQPNLEPDVRITITPGGAQEGLSAGEFDGDITIAPNTTLLKFRTKLGGWFFNPELSLTDAEFERAKSGFLPVAAKIGMGAAEAEAVIKEVWKKTMQRLHEAHSDLVPSKLELGDKKAERADLESDSVQAVMDDLQPIMDFVEAWMDQYEAVESAGDWAFWSGWPAGAVANKSGYTTLEKTVLGSIFDGSKYDGAGRIELWAAMSRQYAEYAARNFETKTYHGFVGFPVEDRTIFAQVEQPTFSLFTDKKADPKVNWYACAGMPTGGGYFDPHYSETGGGPEGTFFTATGIAGREAAIEKAAEYLAAIKVGKDPKVAADPLKPQKDSLLDKAAQLEAGDPVSLAWCDLADAACAEFEALCMGDSAKITDSRTKTDHDKIGRAVKEKLEAIRWGDVDFATAKSKATEFKGYMPRWRALATRITPFFRADGAERSLDKVDGGIRACELMTEIEAHGSYLDHAWYKTKESEMRSERQKCFESDKLRAAFTPVLEGIITRAADEMTNAPMYATIKIGVDNNTDNLWQDGSQPEALRTHAWGWKEVAGAWTVGNRFRQLFNDHYDRCPQADAVLAMKNMVEEYVADQPSDVRFGNEAMKLGMTAEAAVKAAEDAGSWSRVMESIANEAAGEYVSKAELDAITREKISGFFGNFSHVTPGGWSQKLSQSIADSIWDEHEQTTGTGDENRILMTTGSIMRVTGMWANVIPFLGAPAAVLLGGVGRFVVSWGEKKTWKRMAVDALAEMGVIAGVHAATMGLGGIPEAMATTLDVAGTGGAIGGTAKNIEVTDAVQAMARFDEFKASIERQEFLVPGDVGRIIEYYKARSAGEAT